MRGEKERRETSGLTDGSLVAAWPLGKSEKLLCNPQCDGGEGVCLGRNIKHSRFHRSDIWRCESICPPAFCSLHV